MCLKHTGGISVTPISRPLVKSTSYFLRRRAPLPLGAILAAALLEPRPFLQFVAAFQERIAPDTHQDQASAERWPAPWRHGRPRRTLVPHRIQEDCTVLWLPAGRHQSPGGLRCGRSAVIAAVTAIRHPIQCSRFQAQSPNLAYQTAAVLRQSSALRRTACPP
jgi:hypothetical protein